MDLLALLEEIQSIARNGMHYATNPYDNERYSRLLELVSNAYGLTFDLPPADVHRRLTAELGQITPKVGASAAIFDDEGRILLMLRTDDRRWCLPCGWVEPNESPANCAVREAREETGLQVEIVRLIDVFTRLPGIHTGTFTLVSVSYLCAITGGVLHGSHEGLDLRFWEIDAVPIWHGQHLLYAQSAYALWNKRRSESTG